jgi:transcriptional regulator GlxA family with amidase domain
MPQLASPAASHDPRKPTAVVVLGSEGTNVADALPPFEVLARTQRFNLYTVAAERRPMPLTGGLDLVPDLSFAELDDLVPATPEVIVVPQITGERSGGPVTTWVEQQHRQGEPLLVSVCVGAGVLANAGLLDGRPATSHWLKLIGLRRDFPAVDWRADRRYVEDGQLITSAGVLSGVDGALRVVERLVGPAGAERAASAVHWPHYSPGRPAAITPVRPAAGDLVALLSAAYRWDRPTMGVVLTPAGHNPVDSYAGTSLPNDRCRKSQSAVELSVGRRAGHVGSATGSEATDQGQAAAGAGEDEQRSSDEGPRPGGFGSVELGEGVVQGLRYPTGRGCILGLCDMAQRSVEGVARLIVKVVGFHVGRQVLALRRGGAGYDKAVDVGEGRLEVGARQYVQAVPSAHWAAVQTDRARSCDVGQLGVGTSATKSWTTSALWRSPLWPRV